MDGAVYLTYYIFGKKESFARRIQPIFTVFQKFSRIDRSIFIQIPQVQCGRNLDSIKNPHRDPLLYITV